MYRRLILQMIKPISVLNCVPADTVLFYFAYSSPFVTQGSMSPSLPLLLMHNLSDVLVHAASVLHPACLLHITQV